MSNSCSRNGSGTDSSSPLLRTYSTRPNTVLFASSWKFDSAMTLCSQGPVVPDGYTCWFAP
jgi:hypothetical protein